MAEEMTAEDREEMVLNDTTVSLSIETTIALLRSLRPHERSERSRGYAVCITQMEFAEAYFEQYVRTKE